VKKYLLAGLLLWLPLTITIWVLHSLLGVLDGIFGSVLSASQAILPEAARAPLELLRLPGLGVVVMVCALLLTGVLATNIVGQWWLRQGNRLLNRIPNVK